MAERGLPRSLEVVLAAFGLGLSAPLIAVLAALVAATSSGPALFRQRRIGRGGRPFTLFKLRTMYADAGGPRFSYTGDPRVTPFGRFLRHTKLDELTELWNVLRGDLALVGPRPEVPEFVDLEDAGWRRALEDRPGLTHPVTLKLRNAEDLLQGVGAGRADYYVRYLMPYKLVGYLDYQARRSAGSDLRTLLETAWVVLFPDRAPPPSPREVVEGGAR